MSRHHSSRCPPRPSSKMLAVGWWLFLALLMTFSNTNNSRAAAFQSSSSTTSTPFCSSMDRYSHYASSFSLMAPTTPNQRGCLHASPTEDPLTEQKSTTATTREEKLSETDARVLQSMLQDKLDLKTEENLKQLLKRGVVSKQVPTPKKKLVEVSDSEFSSQVLQTLSDTKLWQAISRKAGDWLESAKLYVVNRVERDAMTLAALGVFAWERAVRDVGRALPAAGGSSSTSSSGPKKPFLLSAKSSSNSVRQDMTTPMDELKSVGSAVAEIFKTGGQDGTAPSARVSATGVLRTAATSRQDKRNFQRAYQRAQVSASSTKNPMRVTQRAATSVVDTAWQLKRELQAESNVPGYKSKQVQTALEAATDSTRQLLQGAQETWKLERAKQRERRLQQAADTTDVEKAAASPPVTPADFMDPKTAFFTTTTTTTTPGNTQQEVQYESNFVTENNINNNEVLSPQELQRRQEARQRAERQQAERQQQYELRMQQQRQQLQELRQQQQTERLQALQSLQEELSRECLRLKDQLQNCIVNPEQTWLRSDIIEGVRNFDQTMIRQVVTEMIATRNSLKEIIIRTTATTSNDAHPRDDKIRQMLDELVLVKSLVNEIQGHAQQAVSLGAAQALEQELLEKNASGNSNKNNNDNLIPVLLRLDELQRQFEALMAEEEEDYTEEYAFATSEFDFYASPNGSSKTTTSVKDMLDTVDAHDVDESAAAVANTINAEIVDVIPEAFVYAVATTPMGMDQTDVTTDKIPTNVVSTMAELVTDDDFEAAVGETKRAVAVQDDEDEDAVDAAKEKQENLILMLLLRSLDIFFFLLEKTVTVAIPTVVSSSVTAKDRLDNVAQGGLGSKGWKRIGSAREGARRY